MLYQARIAEHYETLADHYLRGGSWERALHYLTRSGEKATSAGAIREALSHYTQALEVCARLGESARVTAVAVAEKRGFVCYDSGDFDGAVTDFARMRAAAATWTSAGRWWRCWGSGPAAPWTGGFCAKRSSPGMARIRSGRRLMTSSRSAPEGGPGSSGSGSTASASPRIWPAGPLHSRRVR